MTTEPAAPSRPSFDQMLLDVAAAVAGRADCSRRRVGAVLVRDRRIIATGYNGAPAGMPGCLTDGACPRGQASYEQIAGLGDYDRPGQPSFCIAIHAEANALLFSGHDAAGTTCYTTDEPCPSCTRLLAGAGVVRVVWPGGEAEPMARLAGMTADSFAAITVARCSD